MAGKKLSERFVTNPIGSGSNPSRPIKRNTLMVFQDQDEQAPENQVCVGTTEDFLGDMFGKDSLALSPKEMAIGYASAWLSSPYGSNMAYDTDGYITAATITFPDGQAVNYVPIIRDSKIQIIYFNTLTYTVSVEYTYTGIVMTGLSFDYVDPFLSETWAYVNALNGISGESAISVSRTKAINTFIASLKSSVNGNGVSIWELADKIGLLANDSIAKASINMKYPSKVSQAADGLGPLRYNPSYPPSMYQTNKGIVRNANDLGHIYTDYNPLSLGGANGYSYGLYSATVAVWVLSLSAIDSEVEVGDAALNRLVIQSRKTSSALGLACQGTSLYNNTGQTPEAGFIGITRNANNSKIYKRVNAISTEMDNIAATTLAGEVFLLGYGNPSHNSTKPLSFYFIGGGLTAGAVSQMNDLKNAVSTYLTAVGAI